MVGKVESFSRASDYEIEYVVKNPSKGLGRSLATGGYRGTGVVARVHTICQRE